MPNALTASYKLAVEARQEVGRLGLVGPPKPHGMCITALSGQWTLRARFPPHPNVCLPAGLPSVVKETQVSPTWTNRCAELARRPRTTSALSVLNRGASKARCAVRFRFKHTARNRIGDWPADVLFRSFRSSAHPARRRRRQIRVRKHHLRQPSSSLPPDSDTVRRPPQSGGRQR